MAAGDDSTRGGCGPVSGRCLRLRAVHADDSEHRGGSGSHRRHRQQCRHHPLHALRKMERSRWRDVVSTTWTASLILCGAQKPVDKGCPACRAWSGAARLSATERYPASPVGSSPSRSSSTTVPSARFQVTTAVRKRAGKADATNRSAGSRMPKAFRVSAVNARPTPRRFSRSGSACKPFRPRPRCSRRRDDLGGQQSRQRDR